MASSGWELAMRRIDSEYDLPQFVAARLVRKIAANNFRLPSTDRDGFPKLPDHVIARIEQIVRDAYLECGEDVGGDILREHLWQQALAARRKMIANGELLTPSDFKKRVGVTEKRLTLLLEDGSVFAVEVEEASYIPALLAVSVHNRRRLQAICRIIVPAEPISRLDFLSSQRGSLGNRRPLDMLESDDDFKRVQQSAVAWAVEWSRTAVKLYQGKHKTEPKGIDPLYTAAVEIDPRKPLWERASEALRAHGYEWPMGPYPDVREFTLFVERQTAGDATPTPEACVQIVADGEDIRIRVVAAPDTTSSSETMPTGKHRTLIDIAKQVIAYLTNAKRA